MKRTVKKILSGPEAREKLKEGINKVANCVKVTLGPSGRCVLMGKAHGSGTISKDGVSVARQVELEDIFENEGARLCKETASKTNDTAGDGTTSSTVLAQALVNEGLRYVDQGGSATAVKRGIDRAVRVVVEEIDKLAVPVTSKDQIKFVATISGNGDEVGSFIADAMERVGKSGVITLENGTHKETILHFVDGFQFDAGYYHPCFSTNLERMTAEYENVAVLIVEGKLNMAQDVAKILEAIQKLNGPALVICDELDGDGFATATMNRLKNAFPVVFVKAPSLGDRRAQLLEDLGYLTGAAIVSERMKFDLATLKTSHFGKARKVIVSENSTTILEGLGDREQIKSRIKLLTTYMSNAENKYDKERYQERLAKLTGGVALIKVGGSTETEIVERKHRFEDALNATRAAVADGIAFLRASRKLTKLKDSPDELHGIRLVQAALSSPIIQICENAGINGSVIVERILKSRKPGIGFNAATGQMVDMMEAGIVDPARVTKQALLNAASIAGMVLSTDVLIVERDE